MDLDRLRTEFDRLTRDEHAIGLLGIILIVVLVLILLGFITISFRAG